MMGGCDATLTTVTPTGDVVAYTTDNLPYIGALIRATPENVAVVRDGDRLMRLDVTTLTCQVSEPHICHEDDTAVWSDDTKGATPATPPADLQTGPKDGLDLEQPPADVCEDCGGKGEFYHGWDDLTNTEDWRPCPTCSAPAVVEARHGDQQAQAGWGAATGRCAACGLPAHRYGRNEGADRFDPQACINMLRAALEASPAPAVTEAQVEAALAAWMRNLRGNTAFDVMRAALEAARHELTTSRTEQV